MLRGIDDVAEYRAEVREAGTGTSLRVEIEPTPRVNDATDALVEQVSQAIRDTLHFRAEVSVVAPGSLPRFEGKGARFVRIREEA